MVVLPAVWCREHGVVVGSNVVISDIPDTDSLTVKKSIEG